MLLKLIMEITDISLVRQGFKNMFTRDSQTSCATRVIVSLVNVKPFNILYNCIYRISLSYLSVADPEILEPGGAVPARNNFLGFDIVLMLLYIYPMP